jgi:hypothetical protein
MRSPGEVSVPETVPVHLTGSTNLMLATGFEPATSWSRIRPSNSQKTRKIQRIKDFGKAHFAHGTHGLHPVNRIPCHSVPRGEEPTALLTSSRN